MLHQALLHAASPGTQPYDLQQAMAPGLCDCSEWHSEAEASNIALQQQLDDSNAKLLSQSNVQNAEILKLQNQVKTSQVCQEAQEFYCQQALQADMVLPRCCCRLVLPEAAFDLSPNQIHQQLLLNHALERWSCSIFS